MSIHELVSSYGYFAVFALVAVESIGVPLPGETVLVFAATYAGATHRLSIWFVFLVGAGAAVVGDTIGYWIGDLGGYRLLCRYGRYVRMDEPKIKVARYLFDRHGGAVVFFGRFVSILRTYAAFLAGTSQMRYRRFLGFNVAGAVVWAGLYCGLAYKAGGFLSQATSLFGIVPGCVAVVLVVLGIFALRRHIGGLTERAEAAYPGPLDQHRGGRGATRSEPGKSPTTEGDSGQCEAEPEA